MNDWQGILERLCIIHSLAFLPLVVYFPLQFRKVTREHFSATFLSSLRSHEGLGGNPSICQACQGLPQPNDAEGGQKRGNSQEHVRRNDKSLLQG